jgi:uncharacterized damage-inducible protein DinB
MKPHLERLFRFVAWADRRTLDSLRAVPLAAVAEALPLMAHVLAAEHVWLARLEGREPKHPVWPDLSLEACAQLLQENEAGYRAFVERLSDNHLAQLTLYRNAAGQEFQTPVLDILLQVITHGGYHRGQIAKILGRSGVTPASTDFIVFQREGN